MAKLVTAKMSAKKGKGKRGKVRHMHITLADNGATAETHFAPAEGAEDGPYPEPETKVFTDPKELGNHVQGHMADAFPQPAGGSSEPDGDED